MLAYSYNNKDKEYLGVQVEAFLDVKATQRTGQNVYSLPANSTFLVPPEKQQDKTIIFNNNQWNTVNDYRGKRAYNDEGLITINYIGDLQGSDKLLTSEQIEGLDNGTLIWKDGQIIPKPAPTTEEILQQKESQYSMARWQHEYIVANPSMFPEFVLNRAQELENLAEELRKQNANNQNNSESGE